MLVRGTGALGLGRPVPVLALIWAGVSVQTIASTSPVSEGVDACSAKTPL